MTNHQASHSGAFLSLTTMPTIQQAITQAVQLLAGNHDADAYFDAEVLLCHLLGKNRSHLIAWPDKPLSDEQWHTFQTLINRRATGEPVAYITGHREFWSLDLLVSPATLIPRPDTEVLVEQALARIPIDAEWQIADLGTGSGAIALAVASERPHCQLFAIDISAEALDIAKQNAQRLKLSNITFLQGSWLAPLTQHPLNMVLSNPPYIEACDPHLNEGDVRFEPSGALASGSDGLDDIRILINTARQQLLPGGWLLMEHGYHQAQAIMDLMQQQGYSEIKDICDYGGNDRVACGCFKG